MNKEVNHSQYRETATAYRSFTVKIAAKSQIKMENTKITVITVVRNCEKTLEQTMLSVLGQTYNNIEYIVIDGASTDGTLGIIKKYDTRIKNGEFFHIDFQWISELDKGIYDAMNKGIGRATGEWINFINSGDRFYGPDAIANFVRLHNASADITYGDTVMDMPDIPMHYVQKPKPIELMPKQMTFGHPSTFVKTRLMKEKYFDVSYRSCADYKFFLQCYRNHKQFEYIPVSIAIFECGTGITSNYKINRRENARIHGIEHKISWKLSFAANYLFYSAKRMLKGILPNRVVTALKKRNIKRLSNKNALA
jgi:glycosyltransferase involved in cell wall biosynthesis